MIECAHPSVDVQPVLDIIPPKASEDRGIALAAGHDILWWTLHLAGARFQRHGHGVR